MGFARARVWVAAFLAAVMGSALAQSSITGTATYRERIALPPDAVFEATLEDVSKADALAKVLGRATIDSPGAPPFQFTIDYDPARIEPRHRYAVRATIRAHGRLLFTTDTHYPVLTQGAPQSVDLLLRRVGGEAATVPAAPTVTEPLENTYWKLVRLRDEPVIVEPNQREPHIVLHAQGRRVAGSGGCNSLLGGYRLDDNRIVFEKLASTMMACAAGMEQEQRFLGALGEATSWRVLGSHLDLIDADGAVLARLEARHLK